jgi:hypothetical protein
MTEYESTETGDSATRIADDDLGLLLAQAGQDQAGVRYECLRLGRCVMDETLERIQKAITRHQNELNRLRSQEEVELR